MCKKILDATGTILLFTGMLLAFLPHAFHAKAGLGGQAHLTHIITGMIFAVIALVILVYSNNALKTFKFS